jgi:hypothetical protein
LGERFVPGELVTALRQWLVPLGELFATLRRWFAALGERVAALRLGSGALGECLAAAWTRLIALWLAERGQCVAEPGERIAVVGRHAASARKWRIALLRGRVSAPG